MEVGSPGGIVSNPQPAAGYLRGGFPYNRVGHGPRPLVAFQGLLLENKPLSSLSARFILRDFRALAKEFTTYVVNRRPGLPRGITLKDLSNDYATLIQQEFGGPVDVVG